MKYILKGVFSVFDTKNRSRSSIYYTEEEYEKILNDLRIKMLKESRLKKLKLINE